MALVLSLKDKEIVYIGGVPYIICNIEKDHFHIENLLNNETFRVESTKMTEIAPEVMVSAGHYTKSNSIQLAVEAPKHILITRRGRRNANIKGNKK